ncbi:MAG TPA: transketolase [Methylomirabilota bacterium]|nr:transketolase [Methylomirabilota bacterium]
MTTDARILALEDIATQLRVDSVRATTAAGSGHPTSSASAADLVAAIFFDVMRFDPAAPRDPACDRFVLSKGHAAPVLYAAWAAVGALDRKDLVQLRQIDSDLEGHPAPRLPFVDVATGSLGQGLGVGVGLALGARMLGTEARVFVLLGDGEMAEGSVWEAAQMASHEKVENLVAIVDVNGLGQSGPTMLDHDLKTFQRRLAAFGWRVNVIDGHDMLQVTTALRRATRGRGAPTAIVAKTVKGKGLGADIEGKEGWHGKPLPPEMAERVIADLESRLHHLPPPPIKRPRRRKVALPAPQPLAGKPPTGEIATREAYGTALVRLGESDPRVRVLDGDVKNSTFAEKFKERFPDRFVEGWIAEQNMVSTGAGLAAQGLIPFISSFACFLERAADQVRMAGISRSNVKLCGSHAGVSIGEDGPSQMALEDLAFFRAIPEAVVFYPSDGVAADAAVQLAAQRKGVVYIRTTRAKTPGLYGADETFAVGALKTVRRSDGDRLVIVSAGITLHEALAAADELGKSGVAVRVIDLFCVKPLDAAGLLEAARACDNRVLTVEDHYAEGGLGDAVMEAVSTHNVAVHRLAVREIPRSGPPRQLLERYGIGRGAIATKVREILG